VPELRPRREEYAEATRRAILDSAADGFVERGYADASMDDIARAARVTKGALYHHFASKQELFRAVFEEVEGQMVQAVRRAAAGERRPWARTTAGIGAFLDLCLEPRYRRIALEEGPAALGWQLWRQIDEAYALGLVRGTLENLIAAGEIAPQPTDLTARVVMAAVTEAGLAVAGAQDPAAARQDAERLLLGLLDGLRVRPA
jgi:AcrR family transcriptional regulator